MASAREQLKTIEAELQRVQAEIDKLKVEEALLLRLRASMSGEVPPAEPAGNGRRRSPGVKSVVIDIMRGAGAAGMTSTEVEKRVRETVPAVAEKTVGSVLSRLKSDGALTYAGERYYEKGTEPATMGFGGTNGIRMAS